MIEGLEGSGSIRPGLQRAWEKVEEGIVGYVLPPIHKDPFDRMLIVQSQIR
ncbi:MAG: hypothetical protein JO081_09655 [Alphaproteobacteria bacterium]|nr:hypothetical protein [Alphaproteobacteria bacterium]